MNICIHIPNNLPYVLLLQVRALSPFSRRSDFCVSCCLESSSQIIASEAVTQRNDKTGFVFLWHCIALGLFSSDFSTVELRIKYDKDDNGWSVIIMAKETIMLYLKLWYGEREEYLGRVSYHIV